MTQHFTNLHDLRMLFINFINQIKLTMSGHKIPTRLLTINNFVEEHKSFASNGGIRHLIFHSENNGFKSAFKKIGSRVLIDEREFFECVERNNEAQSV